MDRTAQPRATRFLLAFTAALLLSLAVCWAYVVTQPMAFMESGYASRLAQRDLMRNCDLGEVAIFGDSQAEAAIDPRLLPMRVSNFAFGAASPLEIAYLVEDALRCPTKPRLVVLSLDANRLEFISPYLWQNNARTGFLDYAKLQDITQTADALNDPSVRDFRTADGLSGWPRNVLYGLRFPALYFNSLVAAKGGGRLSGNQERYQQTVAARGHTPYAAKPATAEAFEVTEYKTAFKPLPIQDQFMRRLVLRLQQQGVRAVVLPMPYAEKNLSPSVRQHQAQFADYLKSVATGRGFQTLPLSTDAWPQHWYADQYHLAPQGVGRLAPHMGRCLERLMLDGVTPEATRLCDFVAPRD